MKKYLKTALVLCLIASICAIMIALVSFLTSPIIAKNNDKLIKNSLLEIYSNAEFIEIKGVNYSDEIKTSYEVKQNGILVGYVYQCFGKNAYGAIELLVGINLDQSIEKIVLTTNSESFASTVDEHVDQVNNGSKDIADVKCGATYGAILVRNLVDAALNDMKGGN